MTAPPPRPELQATTVYLARHGQSEWNNRSRITGQLNPGLSAKGLLQSHALSQVLSGLKLDAIYTSALLRTRETAWPTAQALALEMVALPDLNEIHLGVLQGRYRDERDPQAQELWKTWQADIWNRRVPGGESYGELTERATAALRVVMRRHAGQSMLLVGHHATNRVLLGTLLDWPQERWTEIRLPNKFFYRIRTGAPADVSTCALQGSKCGVWQPGLIM